MGRRAPAPPREVFRRGATTTPFDTEHTTDVRVAGRHGEEVAIQTRGNGPQARLNKKTSGQRKRRLVFLYVRVAAYNNCNKLRFSQEPME